MNEPDAAATFEAYRRLLFSLAYRMTGTVADAEDLVQETWLRWARADRSDVRSPKDWLCAAVTRLAIDHLRSARVQRERYVGPWLPEPLVEPVTADPLDAVELAESLSLAFLAMLERLTPVERAVLLLRDAFGFGTEDVARIVGKTETNTRQIVLRARQRVRSGRPKFEARPEAAEDVVRAFAEACTTGDVEALLRLVAPDAILWSDGGGKVPAALNPIRGADRIARFLVGVTRKWPEFRIAPVRVNGEPGLIVTSADGTRRVLTAAIAEGRIQALYLIANPDKLARVPAVG